MHGIEMFCTAAYVVAAILPALVHGAPECDGGSMESTDVNDQILKTINERRSTVIKGNQKNGIGTETLPAGKYMNQIYWNCDLEKEAMAGLTADCADPAAVSGKSQIVTSDYYDDDEDVPPLSVPVGTWLDRINDYALNEYKNGAVKYSGENAMTDFSNMINPKTTDIGCALGKCANEDKETKYQFYCLTNQPPVSDGDTIYEAGSGGCEGCPEGTSCDETTKLCARPVAETTTTTTTSTTTTTMTTTTTTTTPLAIFPTGENTMCPDHEGMNDTLRMHYLDTHNYRRSELANGTVVKNNNNTLPQATNMIKLELDCELEAGAIAYAGTCPYTVSDPSTREGIGEHYHRVAISSTVPTYRDGIKNAVTNWWKVVRLYPGIGMQAMFRSNHVGTPIETFTQMGWAKTSKLGCSIVTCKSDYVVICRYYPKGNIVEQNVYIPGTPCSQCMGTCYTDLKLCSA
ncbi:unnamed protein product [Cylicocyclus nassatus]|uniref:SCP domain-containing protein n=1 Tax=Cylicocyclus nassatus TaxID=53992 RepID=A0AA36GYY5_CYLNA|nr:unnamed protein product [Cylicocyclus nassatus]